MSIKNKFKKSDITLDIVNDLLEYEPSTGRLFWKERPEKYFVDPFYAARWNGKHAGREAGVEFGYPNSPNRYIRVRIFQHNFRAHRLVWWILHGELPSGFIDHLDHDGLNNRPDNLRVVTHSDNQKNMRKSKRNTSGVTGVQKKRDKFIAFINVGGTNTYIGTYSSLDKATEARKEKESELGYHENHGI